MSQRIACTYKILNVQSQSWSSLEFVEITTSQLNTELSPTNQKTAKITHRTYGYSCELSTDETKLQVESRTSKKITFHTYWEDEKLAYFASPTTRTHGYSWRKTDFYLWPVRRHLLYWLISAFRIDQSETKAACLFAKSATAPLLLIYLVFHYKRRAHCYINLAGV